MFASLHPEAEPSRVSRNTCMSSEQRLINQCLSISGLYHEIKSVATGWKSFLNNCFCYTSKISFYVRPLTSDALSGRSVSLGFPDSSCCIPSSKVPRRSRYDAARPRENDKLGKSWSLQASIGIHICKYK